MHSSSMPLWVQVLQALAVPVIALVGTGIALQQVHTARVKLKHDLYDRRFAVFQAARKLLAEVLVHRDASDDQIRLYIIGTADAIFLFKQNQDIPAYLEEIRRKVSQLRAIREELRPLPIGEQRTALIAQEGQIFSWLMKQLPDGLVERFKPSLTLEKHSTIEAGLRAWFLHLVRCRGSSD